MANKKQQKLNFQKGRYGRNWKSLRESTGKTIREFADELNYSHSVIAKIEAEINTPTIEQINLYQNYFKVSLDYLVGLTSTRSIEINKITEYTGLSEEAIEILHGYVSLAQDEGDTVPDDYHIYYPKKTHWLTKQYNSLICDGDFRKMLNELESFSATTFSLLKMMKRIKSYEDITNGWLRGYMISAELSELKTRKLIDTIISKYDLRKTTEYENILEQLIYDMNKKSGIFEGLEDRYISDAYHHLCMDFMEGTYDGVLKKPNTQLINSILALTKNFCFDLDAMEDVMPPEELANYEAFLFGAQNFKYNAIIKELNKILGDDTLITDEDPFPKGIEYDPEEYYNNENDLNEPEPENTQIDEKKEDTEDNPDLDSYEYLNI